MKTRGPGDLTRQLGTRRLSSSNQFRTMTNLRLSPLNAGPWSARPVRNR